MKCGYEINYGGYGYKTQVLLSCYLFVEVFVTSKHFAFFFFNFFKVDLPTLILNVMPIKLFLCLR